jgi:hypothetical protein
MTAVLVVGRRAFSYLRWLPLIVAGMGQNVRGRADPPGGGRARPGGISAATYWRRRVVVLAVGIGLVTTVSWAAAGMLAARPAADQGAHRGGTRAAGSAHVSGDRAPSRPSPRPASLPSPHRSTTRSGSAGRAVACAPGQVRLGLSSPQYWYQVGATPRFTVHAVSRRGRPCRFNMGTKFVSVVIAAGGRRVWSSADCGSGGGSHVIVLTRGVPAVVRLVWDRRTSSPGCGGITDLARAGEYRVTAVAGHLRSKTVNVVLGAAGASGP